MENYLIIEDCLFFGLGREPHRSSNRTNMLAGINLQPGAWDRTEGRLRLADFRFPTGSGAAEPLELRSVRERVTESEGGSN